MALSLLIFNRKISSDTSYGIVYKAKLGDVPQLVSNEIQQTPDFYSHVIYVFDFCCLPNFRDKTIKTKKKLLPNPPKYFGKSDFL